MNKFLYILFLLPTIFSCQTEENVSKYPLFVGGIRFDKDFGSIDFKKGNPENSIQYKSAAKTTCFELKNHDKALENFEKQSKVYDFAENIYFKSKVSKIRNKDYLDLKNIALKSYDEGKTMKDAYTHHFNKIYREQIAEL